MTDTRTAERAATIACHYPVPSAVLGTILCSCSAAPGASVIEWAEHVAQALAPQIDEQITDTYLLAVGSCIALIEATTALAVAEESDRNARIIREWAAKVTTAMRRASATITPRSRL